MGKAYIYKKIEPETVIKNDEGYSQELNDLFAWSKMGSYNITIQSNSAISHNQPNKINILVDLSENQRILSLYSLRPCIQMKA